MLSPILAKSTCATCKFCCSFRRQSLWETPVFDENTMFRLKELYPSAKFRSAGKSGKSWTFDISDAYKTNDPEEEAPCPFLNIQNGCTLPSDIKPFDCKIWPLRAVQQKDNTLAVALTPTCPAINKVPAEQVSKLVESGLGKQILDYAELNPDMIKDASEFLSNIVYKKE